MRLKFEWDTNSRGMDVLIARKVRGKISITELQEEMSRNYNYTGAWAVVFKVSDESYQGWGAEPKGDALELYSVDDWAVCPICTVAFSGIEFCPHCGERIKANQ